MRLLVILALLLFLLMVFAIRRAARSAVVLPGADPATGVIRLQTRLLSPAAWTTSHVVATSGIAGQPLFLAEAAEGEVRAVLRERDDSLFRALVSWRGSGPPQKLEDFLTLAGAAVPPLEFCLRSDDPHDAGHGSCIVCLGDDQHAVLIVSPETGGSYTASKDRLPPADTIVTITLQRKQEA